MSTQRLIAWGNTLAVTLLVMTAAPSCGGRADDLGSCATAGSSLGPSALGSPSQLVTEAEIANLPRWQQELLSDPGWEQPYIPPREPTPIEAPTYALLMETIKNEGNRQQAAVMPARLDAEKGVRWYDPLWGWDMEMYEKGELGYMPPDGIPNFGCNSDGSNESTRGYALEDVIIQADDPFPPPIYWSRVLDGWSVPNHFNASGGKGNDALSAVFQMCVNDRTADPTDPNADVEFAELSYRADLAPGVGPGGDCSAATAYAVTGQFWKCFSTYWHTAMPGLKPINLYNILIAPQSSQSGLQTSSGATTATYQEFYFGTVDACYGGAWIFGLESSSSDCELFNEAVAAGRDTGFYVRPIYGLLLKRWQEAQLPGMDNPWESHLGWPVFGPVAYASGSQRLSARGAWYAWGMWFERGFIWWVDYDQNVYPQTPDEAQAYRWTGGNVYCCEAGDTYEPVAPPVYYGGSGRLRGLVVADSYRCEETDAWTQIPISRDRMYNEVTLAGGRTEVTLALRAHPYGGKPDEECRYQYIQWAFRDGSVLIDTTPYEDDTTQVTHTYVLPEGMLEVVYVVRIQVTDGDGVSAFGDSLPIRIRKV